MANSRDFRAGRPLGRTGRDAGCKIPADPVIRRGQVAGRHRGIRHQAALDELLHG